MRRSTVRSSLALACVLLLGCEGRQDLTQHYGVTSPQGGASQGGNGAGAAGASAEAGSAGTIGVAGAAGVPSFGAAGKAGNGAGPSPAVPPSPVQVSGCAQGDVHPAETLVACGLSPTADLVAVDETGFVIARRQAGGLQRIDRQTGAMQLIDDRPAGRGWRRERPSPLRGHELFVPDAVAGTLEVIDLRTGAHRLLTDELATTTSDDLDGALVAIDDARVFLRAAPDGQIGAVAQDATSAAPALIPNAPATSPRVIDGGFVYVEEGRTVRRFPLNGGPLEDVLVITEPSFGGQDAALPPGSWTVAAGTLYWAEDGGFNGQHRVLSRPVAGGEMHVFGSYPDAECSCPPSRLQVREGRLSFRFYNNFYTVSLTEPDATPKPLFPGYLETTNIVFAQGHAYAIGTRGGGEGPLEGYLSRVPLPLASSRRGKMSQRAVSRHASARGPRPRAEFPRKRSLA